MKRLIAAVVLSALVIGLAVSSAITIDRYYNTLTHHIEKIEELHKKGESTGNELSALHYDWEKAEPMLMFFANHDSVEEIGIRINRLVSLSDTKDDGIFKAEAVELKTRLEYLKDSESLTFESVF